MRWSSGNRKHHGYTGHPLHNVWKGMISRCTNPQRRSYTDYGARGIVVCERWMRFENFLADMGPTYGPNLTLERTNNDGPYAPENCTWVPRRRQSRNRRYCTYIDTPWGMLTIAETARIIGVSWYAMRARVRRKWPQNEMFSGPEARNRIGRHSSNRRVLQG